LNILQGTGALLALPPDPKLIEELLAYNYEVRNGDVRLLDLLGTMYQLHITGIRSSRDFAYIIRIAKGSLLLNP
jgi:hypothetical protein